MKISQRTVAFSDQSVRGAVAIDGRRTEYRVQDMRSNDMPRLVLHAFPNGKQVWRLHYDVNVDGRRKRRKVKIGTAKTPLADIRKNWRELNSAVDAGRDPVTEDEAERQRQAESEQYRLFTFQKLAESYMARHSKPKKRSWRTDERRLQVYILPAIGDVPAEDVTKRDVIGIIDRVAIGDTARDGAPVQADRIRKRADERSRERPFTDEELHILWQALANQIQSTTDRLVAIAIQIVAITGQRRQEIIGARWCEVELTGTSPALSIPRERSKNKRPRGAVVHMGN